MTTKLYTIKGKAMWPKILDTPDNYNGVEKYKIAVIPATPKDWDTWNTSGVRTQVKKTQEGEDYVVLSRPVIPKVGKDGKEFGGGQPLVVDENKVKWPNDKRIGNGSDVEVLFSAFMGKAGMGHRLETVMVLKHVPYEPLDADEDTQGLSWKDRPGHQEESEVLKEPKLPF